jgi:predicted transcriptional regulator
MARYTLELNSDLDRILGKLAEANSTSKSDIIRNALASYAYLNEQTREVNKSKETEMQMKVSITNMHDKVIKDVVLP